MVCYFKNLFQIPLNINGLLVLWAPTKTRLNEVLFNQDAVSLKAVRCVSGRNINFLKILLGNLSQSKSNRNHIGLFEYSKKKIFWAKMTSALKRRFLTTAIIKNDTNCRAHLLKKLYFEGFISLRLCRSALYENKAHKVCIFNGFFCWNFFCLTPTLALPPWPEIYLFLSRLSTKFPRCIVGKHHGKKLNKMERSSTLLCSRKGL